MDRLPQIGAEDYFIQRPHHNLMNKFFYSDFMKKYNPLHEWRSYHPRFRRRHAYWYGKVPMATWVDGVVDYSYNKYNFNTIGHFHMHENRKNKPFKSNNGGDRLPMRNLFLAPTYAYTYYPKGCAREVNLYKNCVRDNGSAAKCFDQKINIMEVCPKWVLELLRERKKLLMRATLIDNQTYRRAMRVSDYNANRSLRDISHKKTWEDGTPDKLRSDGYWADDRYSPVVYPSADQNTNIVQGKDTIYSDVLGGNRVEVIYEKRREFMNTPYETLKGLADQGVEIPNHEAERK